MTHNEKERIDESIQKDSSRVYAARKLARFFDFYLRLQIFGQTIFEKHFSKDPEIPFPEKGDDE